MGVKGLPITQERVGAVRWEVECLPTAPPLPCDGGVDVSDGRSGVAEGGGGGARGRGVAGLMGLANHRPR